MWQVCSSHSSSMLVFVKGGGERLPDFQESGEFEGNEELNIIRTLLSEVGSVSANSMTFYHLMLLMEFFTVSFLVFMMLLTIVNWRFSFCMEFCS